MIKKTLLALTAVALASTAAAFPTKPVTIVVPFAAGGPTDKVARDLGVALGAVLKQSVLVENTMATAHCFQELQKQGIQIAIDDFGTGYASLSYLQHFSFDTLKVDQSFVRGIHTNPKAQVIVHSVLDMAEKMGFETVAEGVECPEELQWLRHAGCQVIQGYLIGKPLPPEQWRPEWLTGAVLPPIGATTESDGHGEAQEALSIQ